MKRRQTPFSVETHTPAFAIYILRIMVPTYYLNISSLLEKILFQKLA